MSLFADLYIGDNASGNYTKTYQVVQCQLKVARKYDAYMPDSDPRCDQVFLSVIAPSQNDLELFEWYIDQSSLSGKIVIDLSNQSAKYDITERTFKFENAKCFSIAESYDINETNRHQLKLGIMMEKLEIDEKQPSFLTTSVRSMSKKNRVSHCSNSITNAPGREITWECPMAQHRQPF